MRSRIVAISFLYLAIVITAPAQQYRLGTISGHVVDVMGAAIGGADVFVHSRSTTPDEMKLAAHTDRAGQFRLNLPAGAYDILVVSAGFLAGAETVVISAGKTKQVEWKLKIVPCDFPGVNCDNVFR